MIDRYKDSPLGRIPKEWEVVKLEGVCLPKEGMRRGPFGGAIKKEFFVEKGYQVYEQRNAIYDDFVSARYFIDEEKYEELKAFKIQANDFIISCSGTIGKIAKVPENYSKGIINQALLRLRLDRKKMCDDYFIQQFRDIPFQNKIIDAVQGGAMKNLVGMSEFRKTLVTLPPLPEQQKIAEILGTVDDKIEVIEQQIIETRALKRGLMQRLLTKGSGHTEFKDSVLGMIPKSWEVVTINEIAEVKGGKRLPKGEALIEKTTEHPYIRVTDMFMGGVSLEKILFVPDNIFPLISRYTISKDDLFISVAGTLGIVGEVPFELDGANLTENANKLTNIKINKSFLLQLLLSPFIQDLVQKEQTNNAQPKLALTRIKEFIIPKPPKEEQEKIASVLRTMDNKLAVLLEKKNHYQELKQGLMQQLLTGNIRVKV